MGSLISGASVLNDFHFIPEKKSTTLVYKFGSGSAHSPNSEGVTTMGAGTAIYYSNATGTLITVLAITAGKGEMFLKSYSDGEWSRWNAITTASDVDKITTIQFKRQLTSTDNLNDIVQNGIYFYDTGSAPANAPWDNSSIVEVFGSTSTTGRKIQRVTRHGSAGETAFRPLVNSVQGWLGWAKNVTEPMG